MSLKEFLVNFVMFLSGLILFSLGVTSGIWFLTTIIDKYPHPSFFIVFISIVVILFLFLVFCVGGLFLMFKPVSDPWTDY